MAIKKVKGSTRKKQSGYGRKSEVRSQKKPGKTRTPAAHFTPGQLALHERVLPGRRFVEFPQVKGKVIEKVELFTTREYHSITLGLQDRTALNLRIDPGFTLNASLQEIRAGNLDVIAEWPPIPSSGD